MMSGLWWGEFLELVEDIYGDSGIPLHRPVFDGNERNYLAECIESNFVSSVGARVNEFENRISDFTGSGFSVATVNGTSALHVALLLAGVQSGDEVITQALSFVATCNAVSYTGAVLVFIDVDEDSLGLSPFALRAFLKKNATFSGGECINVGTGRRLAACVPMHTFGNPCRIEEIANICAEYGIPLIEDAAESLGSFVGSKHTGTFGLMAALSFNGNKIVTTGGGGALLTSNEDLAKRGKHLTTTAKLPHPYEFIHDEIGYNYRMPNINAALGCAQLERLPEMLEAKMRVAGRYREFFSHVGVRFIDPLPGTSSNHWLNAIVMRDRDERERFLQFTNSRKLMTRPLWTLMSELQMFRSCQNDGLRTSRWLVERVINLPSSVPSGALIPFPV